MGYTTHFEGEISITPPLNKSEIDYLTKFNETRRMDRKNGPYFVGGTGFMGQNHDADVLNHNSPPEGQPSLWCQWVPTEDGTAIVWDEGEKFYDSAEWMKYLIGHFLSPEAKALHEGDLQFMNFTFDHVLSGVIKAQGEDPSDLWDLIVTDNKVKVRYYESVPGEEREI